MLIPRGTELIRTETGGVKLNADGFELRLATGAREEQGREGEREEQAREQRDRPQDDADMAQMLSKASMGPPQDSVSFVLADGNDGQSSDGSSRDSFRLVGANEDGLFSVKDVTLVEGSGAFFALKLQKAKNEKQLTESAREAESLRKLQGCPFIVQIVDHTVNEQSLLLLILMELGACDLHSFLRYSLADLSVPEICRIWRALVRSVDAAHEQEIIHRDIKPQNFLLVPVTPFADRVLATTTVPREKFVFQVCGDDDVGAGQRAGITAEDRHRQQGDVTLTLRDPVTGKEEVLRLRVKLTDFGLAHPLGIDASHLSVKGCFGTILYMAPETFLPTNWVNGMKKVSKDVDIWALGVILFQMLHDNRTPFDTYYRTDGPIGVAVAATHKDIHREVMVFERAKVCMAERKKALFLSGRVAAGSAGVIAAGSAAKEPIARALLGVWMQTEFLFRMCELCLAFDVSGRVVARDLGRWVGTAFDEDWWRQDVCCAAEASYAKLAESRHVLSIVGRSIAQAALPEVWVPDLIDADVTTNPPHVVMPVSTEENRATSLVRTTATPLFLVPKDAAGAGDLESGEHPDLQSGEDEQDAACVSFRCKVFGIILIVILGASALLAASVGIVRASERDESTSTQPRIATSTPPTIVQVQPTPILSSLPSNPPVQLVPPVQHTSPPPPPVVVVAAQPTVNAGHDPLPRLSSSFLASSTAAGPFANTQQRGPGEAPITSSSDIIPGGSPASPRAAPAFVGDGDGGTVIDVGARIAADDVAFSGNWHTNEQ